MTQFINIATLIPALDGEPTVLIPSIHIVCAEDHAPTLTHRAVRISGELEEFIGYDPRTTQPELIAIESLPASEWTRHTQTHYARFNCLDLY